MPSTWVQMPNLMKDFVLGRQENRKNKKRQVILPAQEFWENVTRTEQLKKYIKKKNFF